MALMRTVAVGRLKLVKRTGLEVPKGKGHNHGEELEGRYISTRGKSPIKHRYFISLESNEGAG